jgi:hypothetical protein
VAHRLRSTYRPSKSDGQNVRVESQRCSTPNSGTGAPSRAYRTVSEDAAAPPVAEARVASSTPIAKYRRNGDLQKQDMAIKFYSAKTTRTRPFSHSQLRTRSYFTTKKFVFFGCLRITLRLASSFMEAKFL